MFCFLAIQEYWDALTVVPGYFFCRSVLIVPETLLSTCVLSRTQTVLLAVTEAASLRPGMTSRLLRLSGLSAFYSSSTVNVYVCCGRNSMFAPQEKSMPTSRWKITREIKPGMMTTSESQQECITIFYQIKHDYPPLHCAIPTPQRWPWQLSQQAIRRTQDG